MDPARTNVDEEQNVISHLSKGSPHVLRKEIRRPQRVDVALDEKIPIALNPAVLRPTMIPRFLSSPWIREHPQPIFFTIRRINSWLFFGSGGYQSLR